MSNKRTAQEKFDGLADALGDSILQESDEEIIAELRLSGVDPDSQAARLKAMMLARVKAHQQRPLQTARDGYKAHIEQLEKKTYFIPKTAPERRQLFTYIQQQPQYAEALTAQFRDLETVTDSDIETYLEDLAELGILEKLNREQGDGEK